MLEKRFEFVVFFHEVFAIVVGGVQAYQTKNNFNEFASVIRSDTIITEPIEYLLWVHR